MEVKNGRGEWRGILLHSLVINSEGWDPSTPSMNSSTKTTVDAGTSDRNLSQKKKPLNSIKINSIEQSNSVKLKNSIAAIQNFFPLCIYLCIYECLCVHVYLYTCMHDTCVYI